MASNATLETLSFNPFIVNENMNDNNQDPGFNFLHEIISTFLDTDYVSPKVLRVSLRIISKTLSLFYI